MAIEHLNRREFARVSLGAAAVATTMASAAAQKPPRDAVEAPRPDKDDAEDAGREQQDLYLGLIQKRYPHPRLQGKVLAAIRRDISADLERGKVLRSYPLSNADEPGFTFSAYRSDAIR